jgi:hypothetical protein
MTRSLAARAAATALLSLALVGAGTSTASARPDPIDVHSATGGIPAVSCDLRRIDTQLVKCDNYTGAGVPAPLFIFELQPLAQPGAR